MAIVPTQLLGFADGGMSQGLLSTTKVVRTRSAA